MSDIIEIKRAMISRAQEIAEHLLPRGVRQGREWCVGDLSGTPGESLKVCVSGSKAGTWADFAAAGESGDLIDLWCHVKGVSLAEAIDSIRSWLGIEAPKFERSERTYRRPNKPKCSIPKSAVLEYLTGERKISPEALRVYRVGEDGRTIIFPSLLPTGELAGVKYLGVDRSPEGKKQTRVEADCEPILFGWQAIDPESREVTISEGEVDSLSSWDYGFPALSVPFGGGGGAKQRWIEAEYERMARFEVIYLALDMDKEGNTAAEEIANRLGVYRCRRVALPRKDLNQCRQDGISSEEIRQCFDAAATLDPPELMRPSNFADAVANLFWPIDGLEPGYRLPFVRAEKLVFRPGELSEWVGASGAGKSQLLSYALIAMAQQGAKVCLASLEMAPAQLLRRLVKQAGNIDRPTERYIRDVIGWLDKWLWLYGLVGKAPVSRLIEVFEYARARYGCDVFGIDSLMRLGVGSEDYEGQEKAVFDLVNWAVSKGVHIHLVAHARKSDRSSASAVPDIEDIKGTSEIGNNAANIIGIWRNKRFEEEIRVTTEKAEKGDLAAREQLEEMSLKPPVTVNVAKQRNGDWEGKFGLWFSPLTYQYRGIGDSRDGRRFMSHDP